MRRVTLEVGRAVLLRGRRERLHGGARRGDEGEREGRRGGMREGFAAAFRQLGKAWRAAASDPKWVAKTAFNVVTTSAGGSTTTRATCAEVKTEVSAAGAAAASPAASTARAHTLADINPGGPTAPGRGMNCVNCAVATDASYASNPATAMRRTAPPSSTRGSSRMAGWSSTIPSCSFAPAYPHQVFDLFISHIRLLERGGRIPSVRPPLTF